MNRQKIRIVYKYKYSMYFKSVKTDDENNPFKMEYLIE